ncbi:telomere length regulation protein TEL2 homolog isoform X1 [Ischnura elegans]|uniref:telomere length regulation protein TEL2 homolog isoform X1 n=1 Tax=Ischnura elegans TaxID=197161 RepID=UPI001ED8700E|nr:telomere length regulation protein TEL2 homolog isoform X1 [Ischnura elegans]
MWNWKVRELADKVANVVMNYTEVEAKVREATNDDAWGPTGALMQEIAQATFTFEHFPEVMSMLWKRMLQDNRRNWRRTYKSLLLLAYLVKNGSERVVTSAREHIYDLRGMENYTLVDETGKDQGINVRVKVRELIDFIQDDDRLREERKKAKKNKDKYVGMSSDSLGLRYGGDRWDDVPRWNKEDTWADSCKNPGNNSGVEEEPYHNHSGDDSDGGFGNERKEGGGGVGRSVYRDNDSSVEVTGGSRTDKVVPKGGRTKTSTPSRKIDLGAAASFGRESYSTSQKTSPTKQASLGSQAVKEDNLLGGVSAGPSPLSSPSKVVEDDDFDPRANETTTQDEFQDFTSASGNLTATPGAGDDDFADFNAFNEGNNNIASLEGNNKLNLQQPQNKQSNSNIMGGSQSNADLLMGLSSFPQESLVLPQSNPVSPLDSSLPPITAGDVEKKPLESSGNVMHRINEDDVMELLPVLRTGGSQCTWNRLLELRHLLLPHPDETDDEWLTKRLHYRRVAEALVEGICSGGAHNVIGHPRRIQEFILTTGYAEESLPALAEGLKECSLEEGKCSKKASRLIELILKVFCSPAVFDMLLNHTVRHNACSSETQSAELMEQNQDWAKVVHLLVSFPSLIANHMQKDLPLEFTPSSYCSMLCHTIAHLFDELVGVRVLLCHTRVARLVGKISMHYKGSLGIEKLIKHFICLCLRDVSAHSLIPSLMKELEPHCILYVAEVILSLSASPKEVFLVLGDECRLSQNWQSVLCSRIPLMSYRGTMGWTSADEVVLHNLVGYLGSGPGGGRRIVGLLKDLVNVWSDSSICKHSSVTQQRWITGCMMACCSRLNAHMFWHGKESLEKDGKVIKLIGWETEDWKDYEEAIETNFSEILSKLFRGVMCHLESLSPQVRVMGMIAAEKVTETFSFKMRAAKNGDEALSPHFEYNEKDEIVASLKRVFEMDFIDKGEDTPDSSSDIWFSSNDLREKVNSQGAMESTAVTVNKTPAETVFRDEVDSEMDSDDEFEPYDMSMDVPESKDYHPINLYDLLDVLSEGPSSKQGENDLEARNRYFSYLEICPDIVSQQLAQNDASLAEGLLLALTHASSVEKAYFSESQISSLVIKAMSAVVAAHPVSGSRILCKRVYSEHSSVRNRLDALLSLIEAARELSGFSKAFEKLDLSVVPQGGQRLVPKTWDLIVKERTESKTRRWGSCVQGRNKESHEEINMFLPVAGHFLFPLLLPEEKVAQNNLKKLLRNNGEGTDDIFVAQLLIAVGSLAIMSTGSPAAISGRVAGIVLEAASLALHNPEASVRREAAKAVGAAIASGAPNPRLALLHDATGSDDDIPSTEGLRKLSECMKILVHMSVNDNDDECRFIAANVTSYVDSCMNM